MTESQKLQIRMSTVRQQANDRTNDAIDRERLIEELSELETEYRTALAAETDQIDQDFTGFVPLTAEFREMQEITGRADLGDHDGERHRPPEPDRGGSGSATGVEPGR